MKTIKFSPYMMRTRRFGVIFACAALLVACAGVADTQPPDIQVRRLAEKRWQAVVAQDFEAAYAMLAPSYRQLKTVQEYANLQRAIPFKRLAAKVINVDCDHLKCAVRIEVESKPISMIGFKGALVSGLDEAWVLEDGRWWLLESL